MNIRETFDALLNFGATTIVTRGSSLYMNYGNYLIELSLYRSDSPSMFVKHSKSNVIVANLYNRVGETDIEFENNIQEAMFSLFGKEPTIDEVLEEFENSKFTQLNTIIDMSLIIDFLSTFDVNKFHKVIYNIRS